MIGQLGDISFEVSSEGVVRTFHDLSRQTSARYAWHTRQGHKELAEFLGAGAASITLKLQINVMGGLDPKEELERLREVMETGEAVFFILDGEPQGDDRWVLTALSETHKVVDNEGRTLVAEANVTMKEYLEVRDG